MVGEGAGTTRTDRSRGCRVLAIDPGRVKCGLAVVERTGESRAPITLHREIVPTDQAAVRVAALRTQFDPEVVLLGNGTQSKTLSQALPTAVLVPEAFTSQRARERRRRAQPWWRRWKDAGEPYDDLVAVILAEDWLQAPPQR